VLAAFKRSLGEQDLLSVTSPSYLESIDKWVLDD
jgi:hypothetical protein